jgi:hypothetical protein
MILFRIYFKSNGSIAWKETLAHNAFVWGMLGGIGLILHLLTGTR